MTCKCKVYVDQFSYDTGYTVEHERFNGSETAEILFETHSECSATILIKTLCSVRANNLTRHAVGETFHVTIDDKTKHFHCMKTDTYRPEYGIYKIKLEGYIEEVPKVELGY